VSMNISSGARRITELTTAPSGDRSKPASRGRVKSGQLLQDAFL